MNADVARLIELAESERIITADEAGKLGGFIERKQGDIDAATSYLARFHNVDPQVAEALKARAIQDAATGVAPPPPRRASQRVPTAAPTPQPLPPGIQQPLETDDRLALTIVGCVLIANALRAFASLAVVHQSAGIQAGITGSPISGIIDILIGASLVTGNAKYRPWAIIRVVLGGLLFCGAAFSQGDTLSTVLQAAFSGSLLALLIPNASKVRVAVGTGVAGICLLLGILSIVALSMGKPLFRGAVVKGKLEEIQGGKVTGEKFPYRLSSPGRDWKVRRSVDAHTDNAVVDRWLVDEKHDAHILVIAERVDLPPGAHIEMDKFESTVVEQMGKSMTGFKVLDQAPLGGPWDGAQVFHAQGTLAEAGDVEYLCGLFIKDTVLYRVVAFTPKATWGGLSSDFRRVVTGFEAD